MRLTGSTRIRRKWWLYCRVHSWPHSPPRSQINVGGPSLPSLITRLLRLTLSRAGPEDPPKRQRSRTCHQQQRGGPTPGTPIGGVFPSKRQPSTGDRYRGQGQRFRPRAWTKLAPHTHLVALPPNILGVDDSHVGLSVAFLTMVDTSNPQTKLQRS